ncbi:MAG: hypothetical protein ABIH21_00450 [Patescibacteria group bacterium]
MKAMMLKKLLPWVVGVVVGAIVLWWLAKKLIILAVIVGVPVLAWRWFATKKQAKLTPEQVRAQAREKDAVKAKKDLQGIKLGS